MCNILGVIADSRVLTTTSLRGSLCGPAGHRWSEAFGLADDCTLHKTQRPSSEIALSISRDVLVGRSCDRSDTGLAAAHPFRIGRWSFAHDGAIHDASPLRRRISTERVKQLEGDTTSELFFAYLLGWLDASEASDVALERAAAAIAREVHGSTTFVLSDGVSMYAYRRGRPLFVLQRDDAVLFATEPMTNDAWLALANGVVIRADRAPARWRFLVGADLVDSRPELPFTD